HPELPPQLVLGGGGPVGVQQVPLVQHRVGDRPGGRERGVFRLPLAGTLSVDGRSWRRPGHDPTSSVWVGLVTPVGAGATVPSSSSPRSALSQSGNARAEV